MFNPDKFKANEAWVAFRINEFPLMTTSDGGANVLALMDIASRFVLTSELFPSTSPEPSQLESKRLLKKGYVHKKKFPKQLFIPTELTADILSNEAEKNGITVTRLSSQELLIVTAEVMDSFNQRFGGHRTEQ